MSPPQERGRGLPITRQTPALNAPNAPASIVADTCDTEQVFGPLEPVDQWTVVLPSGDLMISTTWLRRVAR